MGMPSGRLMLPALFGRPGAIYFDGDYVIDTQEV